MGNFVNQIIFLFFVYFLFFLLKYNTIKIYLNFIIKLLYSKKYSQPLKMARKMFGKLINTSAAT